MTQKQKEMLDGLRKLQAAGLGLSVHQARALTFLAEIERVERIDDGEAPEKGPIDDTQG